VAVGGPRWARVACDPDLPEQVRRLATVEGSASPRQRRHADRELRRHPDQVIFPHSLDVPARLMLARAQQAIDIILGSDVRAAGMLEADELALRRHEWDIACAARELTQVRTLPAPEQEAGAMTAGVLQAQQRAVELAEEATQRRVGALERYAGQVAAADSARRDWESALQATSRDWQSAHQLAGQNDRYLDLLARTAADDIAVTEIDDLAQRTAAVATTLRNALQDASLAAEVLELPPAQAS
jgi:hypothetical protein